MLIVWQLSIVCFCAPCGVPSKHGDHCCKLALISRNVLPTEVFPLVVVSSCEHSFSHRALTSSTNHQRKGGLSDPPASPAKKDLYEWKDLRGRHHSRGALGRHHHFHQSYFTLCSPTNGLGLNARDWVSSFIISISRCIFNEISWC